MYFVLAGRDDNSLLEQLVIPHDRTSIKAGSVLTCWTGCALIFGKSSALMKKHKVKNSIGIACSPLFI